MPFRTLDYLVTYGIAVIVIAAVSILVFHFGISKSASLLGTTCIASTDYVCSNPQLFANGSLRVGVGQSASSTITLVGIACTINSTEPVNWAPVNRTQLSPEQIITLTFSCPANPSSGSFSGYLWLKYLNPDQTGVISDIGQVTATSQPS